jgi:hypothetical protein
VAAGILLPAAPTPAQELGPPPTFPAYLPAPRTGQVPQVAASGLSVSTAQRETVRNFYNALFLASDGVAMGWTGSLSTCTPGTTNPAYRDAVALRINVIRALAGVPAGVTLDSTYNAKAQQSALMMSANKQLSHAPAASWPCYTAAGAEAASHSNLNLGSAGADAISQGYLADTGDNNTAIGHRRWLLYPQTQQMGTGDIPGDSTHPPINDLWVFDSHTFDARPATRNEYVAWPPPGYIPYNIVYARWSFSYPNADFTAATVSMSRNGVSVPVVLEPLANGYGDNTIVWRPTDSLLTNPSPLANTDAVFTVNVNNVQNVKITGQTRSFSYTVKLFDPNRNGEDTILPKVSGNAQAVVGQNNLYQILGQPPLATSFDWLSAKTSAYNAVQGAENGLGQMAAATSAGYAVIATDAAAVGTHSYHLNHSNNCTEQTLTLQQNLLPTSKSVLSFYSRLGLVDPAETAAVQVSADGGKQWQDVYTQSRPASGSGTDWGELTFNSRQVSLSAFAGKIIKVRFNFKQANRCYFPGVGIGWYLDNVAFANTSAVTAQKIAAAAADKTFNFNPAAAGHYVLAARGKIKGHPLEWGVFKSVTAASAP